MLQTFAAEGGYQVFSLQRFGVVLADLRRRRLDRGADRRLGHDARRPGQGRPAPTKMGEIAAAVQEGAMAYIKRQFRTILIIVVPLAVIVFVTSTEVLKRRRPSEGLDRCAVGPVPHARLPRRGARSPASSGSSACGSSTRANVRTAAAAKTGTMDAAMQVAFQAGGTSGLFTAGLGLLGATLIVMIFQNTASAILVGLRLRWLAARAVPARRRRHLHQGGRRRRRPRRQGRGGHPRGRSPQPRHHRRQRRRQRR